MLLEVQGVHKSYGRILALRDVNLSLPRGSIGLLGPNGAGKSTLLKVLLGFLPPSRGAVEVLGFDAATRPLDLRQRVGYMPEQECYVAGLDAVEMCTYAGELCGLPRAEAQQRAHAVLAYVGLEDKRYLQVQTYSTGQKQRVKLAQALVHDPELLLLDEPTNGLDPRGRDEMLALIRQLPRRRDCSIILSSHLLPDVEAICDHAILLDQGQVRYSGSIAEMHEGKRHTYEVRVKDGRRRLGGLLEEAGCGVELQDGCLLVELCAGGDPDLIFAQALEAGIQVRHLAPVRQSLESAFVRILAGAAA